MVEKGKMLCTSATSAPVIPFENQRTHVDDDDLTFNFTHCSICYDVFSGPVLQCCWGHAFCAECILQWLSKKQSCPQCRKPMTKVHLARNLLAEQAIEELVLKKMLKAPVETPTKKFQILIPETTEPWNSEMKRQMLMKVVGCNFLILAVFFIGVAVFFEEHLRSTQHDITRPSSSFDSRTSMLSGNSTLSSLEEEHVPMSVILNELAYYISTGASVALSFMIRKAAVALKVFLSITLWLLVKIFIAFSYVMEFALLAFKIIASSSLSLIEETGRVMWGANLELVTYFFGLAGLI